MAQKVAPNPFPTPEYLSPLICGNPAACQLMDYESLNTTDEILVAGTPIKAEPWSMWTNGRTTRIFDGNGNPWYDIDLPGHHYPQGEYHMWVNGIREKRANPF